MNDHKATLEHWAAVEAYAQEVSSTDDCLLELRARVETLEKRCEVLQDRHHRLTLKVGHLEHDLYRDDDDEPQQHCLEAMDPPEANSQPTPNDRQIRSSLVERVADAIVGQATSAGIVNDRPARAAIFEVAAWLRTSTDLNHGPTAARFLVEEANPTSDHH